ncbi:hypothetical protein ACFQD1_56240, partial [Nonomuraea thailandensis]
MTSPNATSEIGPKTASADGSANTPVPMTEPTTSADAVPSPKRPPPGSAPASAGPPGSAPASRRPPAFAPASRRPP